MTPSGIELATFRFVVQHLNHCATAVTVLNTVVNCNTTVLYYNIFILLKSYQTTVMYAVRR